MMTTQLQVESKFIIQEQNKIAFLQLLKQIRQDASMSQEQVAHKLAKPQSFVSKYESGERRLDVLELRQICICLNTDLLTFIDRLEQTLDKDINES